MNKFGQKLKELRIANGLSVRGFAASIGKSPGYISRIEGRGEIPSTDFITQVAAFFESDLEEFLALVKKDQLRKTEKEIDSKHKSTLQLFRKGKKK